MKTIKIENAKTRFFESKEHYLKFRQAWKDFHNNRDHMRTFEYTDDSGEKRTGEVPVLDASHYMLYSLLRGYEANRGFSKDSDHGWQAYDCALSELLRAIRSLKDVNSPSEWSRKWARERVDALTLPFGETLSESVLVALAREIYPDFPAFEPEQRKDFTKVEKQEKVSLKKKLLDPFRRTA